ncbi:DUF1279 super [Coemansia thaxteri]|uniref:DUF1279 super n=1 Tax=Coemansia thaxteri TaxID=2663907 RepID=A0A9W8EKJ7_9FUNG|nr:DUF1279 super [Coemansia thaxteri]KAJ2006732.1 DUF1279 super [Coemansia thaxteri]KAJ2466180.1 DUF1279 super [Coemansia sp. RSA 2322]KAJ2487195.1 DUF1279 super [Coemansia sp. RSA 2320]
MPATHYSISVPGSVSASSSVTSIASTVGVRGMSSVRDKKSDSEDAGRSSESDLEKGAEGGVSGGGGATESGPKKPPSKFRVLMQQYGRVAILMYMLVSAVDLSLCVWGVWLGGDSLVFTIDSYLGEYIPRLHKAAERMREGQDGGADKWATILIVGYAVHKCLTPLRLAITAAVLPWSARTAQRLGLTWLIPKSAPTITHRPLSSAADAVRRKLK